MTNKLKVSFLTLGCKVNQTESEALNQLLTSEGYEVVHEAADPDVVIINTCTVTGTGSSKSRKLIRRMAKEHPLSTIAVMGCYSQTQPEEVSQIEGVDLVLGTQDRATILNHLHTIAEQKKGKKSKTNAQNPVLAVRDFESQAIFEELPLIESETRVRAMLKIQDGCSQFCTYCIVPYARGPARSRSSESVISEAEKLLEAGHKEIVLTGIHTGAYGKDQTDMDLSKLISQLAQLPQLLRLRISSIEPREFSEELLAAVISHKVVCPHFHIPLQSGSGSVLARMKRPYGVEDYALLLNRIREKLPNAAITTDVMTGFPGETELEHKQSLEFIETCEFSGLHVFPYSRRIGTTAAEMPGQLPRSIKTARVQEIIALGQMSRTKYIDRFIGKPMEVLVEKIEEDGSAQGHTSNYLEIGFPGSLNPGDWQVGQIIVHPIKPEYIVSKKG